MFYASGSACVASGFSDTTERIVALLSGLFKLILKGPRPLQVSPPPPPHGTILAPPVKVPFL